MGDSGGSTPLIRNAACVWGQSASEKTSCTQKLAKSLMKSSIFSRLWRSSESINSPPKCTSSLINVSSSTSSKTTRSKTRMSKRRSERHWLATLEVQSPLLQFWVVTEALVRMTSWLPMLTQQSSPQTLETNNSKMKKKQKLDRRCWTSMTRSASSIPKKRLTTESFSV